ncbi:hypothetical protein D3C86_2087680 [compost metagenome]
MTQAQNERGAGQVQAHPVQAPQLQHQANITVFQALAQAQHQRWQAGDEHDE